MIFTDTNVIFPDYAVPFEADKHRLEINQQLSEIPVPQTAEIDGKGLNRSARLKCLWFLLGYMRGGGRIRAAFVHKIMPFFSLLSLSPPLLESHVDG